MKVSRKEFLDGVTLASMATGAVGTTSGSLLFGEHTVTGENGFHRITAPSPVEGIGLCVPADLLNTALSSMTSDEVEVTQDKDTLVLKGGGTHRLSGLNADAFITRPQHAAKWEITTSLKAMSEAVSSVAWASARYDASIPVIAGILLESDGQGKLAAVATNRHVVGRRGGEFEPTETFVLSSDTARILSKLANEWSDGDVRIEVGHDARFTVAGVEFRSTLLSGSYPPYRNVLPTDCEVSLLADRESLLAAVETALSYSGRELSGRCILTVEANGMTIEAETETASFRHTVDVAASGEHRIAFNSSYLANVLRRLRGTGVTIWLNGEKPSRWTGSDPGPTFHVLPQRLP